jgi:hypothetical protein
MILIIINRPLDVYHGCIILLLFILVIFIPFQVVSQQNFNPVNSDLNNLSFKKDSLKQKDCQQKDIFDLLKRKNKTPKPPKKKMLLILPKISSNPTNGLQLGVGVSLGWFLGSRNTTRVSFLSSSVSVTTKKQFLSFVKSYVYM